MPRRRRFLRGHQLRLLQRQGHRELPPRAARRARRPACPSSTPYRKSWASCAPSLPRACSKTSPTTRNRGRRTCRLFEVGKVFFKAGQDRRCPGSRCTSRCAISGKEREYFWRDPVRDFDFFDLKGVLEGLFERFNLRLRAGEGGKSFPGNRPRRRTSFAGDGKVGWIGALRESVRAAYDADEQVWCARIGP